MWLWPKCPAFCLLVSVNMNFFLHCNHLPVCVSYCTWSEQSLSIQYTSLLRSLCSHSLVKSPSASPYKDAKMTYRPRWDHPGLSPHLKILHLISSASPFTMKGHTQRSWDEAQCLAVGQPITLQLFCSQLLCYCHAFQFPGVFKSQKTFCSGFRKHSSLGLYTTHCS